MKLQTKILIFITILFTIAIGNSGLSFLLESYGEEKLHWVNHTHEVIIATEEFLSDMQDTETGQRGFIITKDPNYLEPFHRGKSSAKEHIKDIITLTNDNPEQQKRLAKIEDIMMMKFDELDTTIYLTKNNEDEKALEIITDNRGKIYMDDIRALVLEIINVEQLLLEKRKGEFQTHKARITTFITAEVLFFIFLAIMTVTFLKRQLFSPLQLLLSSTQKMDAGAKVDITDIVPNDEMGFLLSSFYKMNEKVYKRTQKLNYQAHHDELTGLANRTKLSQKINESIEQAYNNNSKVACLFLDLNKFKPLNDRLGHDAGDIALKETALKLKSAVRSDDDVFRIGGDEFIILLKGITDAAQVQNIVNHINETFSSPVLIQGESITISLSIGCTISPDDTCKGDEILKFSDIAMYYAKGDPNSNFCFFKKEMLKRASD